MCIRDRVHIAYCPERVLPGQILKELIENDRSIGGITPRCARKALAFYKRFVRGACVTTDARCLVLTDEPGGWRAGLRARLECALASVDDGGAPAACLRRPLGAACSVGAPSECLLADPRAVEPGPYNFCVASLSLRM